MKNSFAQFVVFINVFLLLAANSYALDGKRKGFLLGLGAGMGSNSYHSSYLSYKSDSYRKTAKLTNFKIGFAPNNNLQIFWSSRVAWFKPEDADKTWTSGIGGLGISYYLNESGPSTYFTGTLGLSSWAEFGGTDSYTGSGFAMGAGYEFSPHLSVEGVWSKGSPRKDDFEINTNVIRITINALWY